MQRKKYKLVCLNQDECGYTEYFDFLIKDSFCTVCGSPALPYTTNTRPLHFLSEEELQKQSIQILANAIERIKND